MDTPLAQQVMAIRAHRARVEEAFLALVESLKGCLAGAPYSSSVIFHAADGSISLSIDDAQRSGHTLLSRNQAILRSPVVSDALCALFPQVPAYHGAESWSKPIITLTKAFGATDGWSVALDIDRRTMVTSTPRTWTVAEAAEVLAALWSVPLAHPTPNDDAGVWTLADYKGSGLFKPQFWAPDSFTAQLVGAILWEPKIYNDWLCGMSLATIVRRMPRQDTDMDHLRALFV